MITILVTNYNNEEWVEKCLKSLLSQTCQDWHCYVMDDVSTDNSPEIVAAVIGNDSRFKFIRNQVKKYQVGNYCAVMPEIPDQNICLTLDGDDWLMGPHVLDVVNETYSADTYLAWGGMCSSSGDRTYNPSIEEVYTQGHVPFHLRTWRASLWHQIADNMLRDEHDDYFRVAGDLAFMIEMVGLTSPANCKTFYGELYWYNDTSSCCNHFIKSQEQQANDTLIRNRRKRRIYL